MLGVSSTNGVLNSPLWGKTKNHSVKLKWTLLQAYHNLEGEYFNLSLLKPQMDACCLGRCLWLKLMECRWHRREPSSATLRPSTTCMGRTGRRPSGTTGFMPVFDSYSSFCRHQLRPGSGVAFHPELRREGKGNKWETSSCYMQQDICLTKWVLHIAVCIPHSHILSPLLTKYFLITWLGKLFYMEMEMNDLANKYWAL